jgi:hypothetical protein
MNHDPQFGPLAADRPQNGASGWGAAHQEPLPFQHALSESRDASCWQCRACLIMSSCSTCTRLCSPRRTVLMAAGMALRVDGAVVSESSMTGVGLCPTANMACLHCGHHPNTFCQHAPAAARGATSFRRPFSSSVGSLRPSRPNPKFIFHTCWGVGGGGGQKTNCTGFPSGPALKEKNMRGREERMRDLAQ